MTELVGEEQDPERSSVSLVQALLEDAQALIERAFAHLEIIDAEAAAERA